MQFNSHASNFDIVSDIDFWAGTNSTSYPIATKTRNVNLAYDRVVSLILQADANWTWDDSNSTDLPIATGSVSSGQQDIAINTAHLKLLRVAITDRNGNYYYLDNLDDRELGTRELMDRDSGQPYAYTKRGNSILLDKPVSYAATIKLYFQRNVSYFTTADTTKTPGFAEPFHRLLSLHAAKDYCAVNDIDKRYAKISTEIEKLETALQVFYAQRSRDERPRIKPRRENYGSEEAGLGSSSNTFG